MKDSHSVPGEGLTRRLARRRDGLNTSVSAGFFGRFGVSDPRREGADPGLKGRSAARSRLLDRVDQRTDGRTMVGERLRIPGSVSAAMRPGGADRPWLWSGSEQVYLVREFEAEGEIEQSNVVEDPWGTTRRLKRELEAARRVDGHPRNVRRVVGPVPEVRRRARTPVERAMAQPVSPRNRPIQQSLADAGIDAGGDPQIAALVEEIQRAPEARRAEALRRGVRRLRGTAGIRARAVASSRLDSISQPTSVARSRFDGNATRTGGLRPVLRTSPSMIPVEALDQFDAEAEVAPRGAQRRVGTTGPVSGETAHRHVPQSAVARDVRTQRGTSRAGPPPRVVGSSGLSGLSSPAPTRSSLPPTAWLARIAESQHTHQVSATDSVRSSLGSVAPISSLEHGLRVLNPRASRSSAHRGLARAVGRQVSASASAPSSSRWVRPSPVAYAGRLAVTDSPWFAPGGVSSQVDGAPSPGVLQSEDGASVSDRLITRSVGAPGLQKPRWSFGPAQALLTHGQAELEEDQSEVPVIQGFRRPTSDSTSGVGVTGARSSTKAETAPAGRVTGPRTAAASPGTARIAGHSGIDRVARRSVVVPRVDGRGVAGITSSPTGYLAPPRASVGPRQPAAQDRLAPTAHAGFGGAHPGFGGAHPGFGGLSTGAIRPVGQGSSTKLASSVGASGAAARTSDGTATRIGANPGRTDAGGQAATIKGADADSTIGASGASVIGTDPGRSATLDAGGLPAGASVASTATASSSAFEGTSPDFTDASARRRGPSALHRAASRDWAVSRVDGRGAPMLAPAPAGYAASPNVAGVGLGGSTGLVTGSDADSPDERWVPSATMNAAPAGRRVVNTFGRSVPMQFMAPTASDSAEELTGGVPTVQGFARASSTQRASERAVTKQSVRRSASASVLPARTSSGRFVPASEVLRQRAIAASSASASSIAAVGSGRSAGIATSGVSASATGTPRSSATGVASSRSTGTTPSGTQSGVRVADASKSGAGPGPSSGDPSTGATSDALQPRGSADTDARGSADTDAGAVVRPGQRAKGTPSAAKGTPPAERGALPNSSAAASRESSGVKSTAGGEAPRVSAQATVVDAAGVGNTGVTSGLSAADLISDDAFLDELIAAGADRPGVAERMLFTFGAAAGIDAAGAVGGLAQRILQRREATESALMSASPVSPGSQERIAARDGGTRRLWGAEPPSFIEAGSGGDEAAFDDASVGKVDGSARSKADSGSSDRPTVRAAARGVEVAHHDDRGVPMLSTRPTAYLEVSDQVSAGGGLAQSPISAGITDRFDAVAELGASPVDGDSASVPARGETRRLYTGGGTGRFLEPEDRSPEQIEDDLEVAPRRRDTPTRAAAGRVFRSSGSADDRIASAQAERLVAELRRAVSSASPETVQRMASSLQVRRAMETVRRQGMGRSDLSDLDRLIASASSASAASPPSTPGQLDQLGRGETRRTARASGVGFETLRPEQVAGVEDVGSTPVPGFSPRAGLETDSAGRIVRMPASGSAGARAVGTHGGAGGTARTVKTGAMHASPAAWADARHGVSSGAQATPGSRAVSRAFAGSPGMPRGAVDTVVARGQGPLVTTAFDNVQRSRGQGAVVRGPDGRFVQERPVSGVSSATPTRGLAGLPQAGSQSRINPITGLPEIVDVGAGAAATGLAGVSPATFRAMRGLGANLGLLALPAAGASDQAEAIASAIGGTGRTSMAAVRSALRQRAAAVPGRRAGSTAGRGAGVGAARPIGGGGQPGTQATGLTGVRTNRRGAGFRTGVVGAAGRAGQGDQVSAGPIGSRGATRRATTAAEGEFLDVSEAEQADSFNSEIGVPNWVRRATHGTVDERGQLQRSGGGLLHALARATRPEDVVRVLTDDPASAQILGREMPGPAGRLVQEIVRAKAAMSDGAELLQPTRASAAGEGEEAIGGGRQSQNVTQNFFFPSRARRTPGGSGGSATSTDGQGASRLMKLSSKLMGLIHLAEVERRKAEAQAMVRMAEDTAEAQAEGGMAANIEGGQEQTMNLASLQREVLAAVRSELELTMMRREGGPYVGIWW